MKKFKKLTFITLAAVIFSIFCTFNCFALTFNGSGSAAGDGSSTTNSRGGYAIPDMLANNSNRAVAVLNNGFKGYADIGISRRGYADIRRL